MNKATKGALAAVAAGSLMVGGAGTLAFWTGTGDVAGATIQSGKLTISDTPVCTGTGLHGWQFQDGTGFTGAAGQEIVPGDTLSKVCTLQLSMVGKNIGASLAIATPSYETPTGLTAELPATATFLVDGAAYTAPLDGAGDHTVKVTITVPFSHASATNASQDLSAVLEAVTVTATQTTNP